MKAFSKLAVILISFGLLVGCSGSKEEAISQSKQAVESIFNEPAQKTTETTEGFSYYLPEGFKIEEEFGNNVILSKGKQEYILFVNPHESLNSDVIFNEIKGAKDEKGTKTFKDKDRFGYISISPGADKKYELIVGIGGVKTTTMSTTSDMVENAKNMMTIANSVEYGQEGNEEKKENKDNKKEELDLGKVKEKDQKKNENDK
ncbi:MAG TPA: hypothetical protein GXX18_14340 [Bacillales bacterium]|nr:hypothetical protein [Bacillales bacterium]